MLHKLALAALVWLVVPLACVQAQVNAGRFVYNPLNGSYVLNNSRLYRTPTPTLPPRLYPRFPSTTPQTVFEAPLYVQVVPTPAYAQPRPAIPYVPANVTPASPYSQLAATPVYVQPTPSSGFVPPTSSPLYVQPSP
jgi:hypothetical protein